MPLPSAVKFTKNGVEYVSQVEKVGYTIAELTRAALRDCGKLITREARKRARRKTGRVRRSIQYWLRKREGDLQVGYKPLGFYGGFAELGTSKQAKEAALFNSVQDNLDEMRRIQGQYLSAIEDENRALGLIDESEVISDENE